MVPSLEVVLGGVSRALFLVLSFHNFKEMELTEYLKANVSKFGPTTFGTVVSLSRLCRTEFLQEVTSSTRSNTI